MSEKRVVPDKHFTLVLFSFGFKHGPPGDADMVWDVRFLPNPYWVPELRQGTGLVPEVASYVLENQAALGFLEKLEPLLLFLARQFQKNGRTTLTMAFGCTGGRHRSVAITEHVGKFLDSMAFHTHVFHRDIKKP